MLTLSNVQMHPRMGPTHVVLRCDTKSSFGSFGEKRKEIKILLGEKRKEGKVNKREKKRREEKGVWERKENNFLSCVWEFGRKIILLRGRRNNSL